MSNLFRDIVAQNIKRDQAIAQAFVSMVENEAQPMEVRQFSAVMAIQSLIEIEERIIRTEWYKSVGVNDSLVDPVADLADYVLLRKKASQALGSSFDEFYTKGKASHNECARANLGDHGKLYCFVLPVFYEDGTHEPWGEKDVPWGTVKTHD